MPSPAARNTIPAEGRFVGFEQNLRKAGGHEGHLDEIDDEVARLARRRV
jgi:hypothetical protein